MQQLKITAKESFKESFNESIKREDYLAENAPQSVENIRYENIVYQNTVAALLSGATLTGRNGKSKYILADYIWPTYTQDQINQEARVVASYVVG